MINRFSLNKGYERSEFSLWMRLTTPPSNKKGWQNSEPIAFKRLRFVRWRLISLHNCFDFRQSSVDLFVACIEWINIINGESTVGINISKLESFKINCSILIIPQSCATHKNDLFAIFFNNCESFLGEQLINRWLLL